MYKDFILYKLQSGDEDAFRYVFNNYYRGLVLVAMNYTKDQDQAEDIVQGVLVKLWEEREKIVIRTSLESYLVKMVRNKCLDSIKHEQIHKKYESVIRGKEEPVEERFAFLTRELKKRIEEAVNNLPEKAGKVFRMSRYDNKKYREIAEEMNMSVKTVESYMGKALRILREELKDWF